MPLTVVIALGSNLGDREWFLRRAVAELRHEINVVRLSSFVETEPLDAPPASPMFLNAVVAGHTRRSPNSVLDALLKIEWKLGRRRTIRNAPRFIDLDLILYSAHLARSVDLVLPHPRYLQRAFVLGPIQELGLSWRDPATNASLGRKDCSTEWRPVRRTAERGLWREG